MRSLLLTSIFVTFKVWADHPAPELLSVPWGQPVVWAENVQPPTGDFWKCRRISTYQGAAKKVWRVIVQCKADIDDMGLPRD